MKLLVTGFEPFGGSLINPSELVVQTLAQATLPGIELETAVLPVAQTTGPAALIQAVRTTQSEAVLCLGEAGGRAALSVERVFVNLMDYSIADNSGNRITDQPIAVDGPAAYFATLPVRAMVEAIAAAGIPAEFSLSAGAYLCNQVSYALLHFLQTEALPIPAGFMHLPYLPQQVANSRVAHPSMSLETMVQGVTIALQIIAGTQR
ncbi:MAG: pyroglutamyl-peptidase I [Ardenticatenaceae bacterium]|nr:pyroglutamyl-peptidase I [Ardenticatenaceae bacterium]